MSKPAKSVLASGVYHALLGTVFLIEPNFLLTLFGFPVTSEIWIRVAGVSIMTLAFYDIQSARAEMVDFFRWTVPARLPVVVCFSLFVTVGLAGSGLIFLGIVELLGALWTAFALRSPRVV